MCSNDDSDFVLAEDFNDDDVALGETSVDILSCSIGQLSDRQINAMTRHDLEYLLRMPTSALCPGQPSHAINDTPELRHAIRAMRDQINAA